MSSDAPVLHWDDARTWRGERGHIAGTWRSLTGRGVYCAGLGLAGRLGEPLDFWDGED